MSKYKYNPDKHKYCYYCYDCNTKWFSDSTYDDLCPAYFCESYDITSTKIRSKDRRRYLKLIECARAAKKRAKKLSKEANSVWSF